MEKSAKRTVQAIKNKHKVGIFGDYDVDGASATALLANFFSKINICHEIYIPDRKTEGYGPSIEFYQKLIDNGVKLYLLLIVVHFLSMQLNLHLEIKLML